MSTATVFIEGLCLWLTSTAGGGMTVLVPDFTNAIPAHSASLRLPKESIAAGRCPDGFTSEDGWCVFPLYDKGRAGGVHVTLTGATAVVPEKKGLCLIPPIQHTQELTLRPEYAPAGGTGLAAQLHVDRGSVEGFVMNECTSHDCSRGVRWTLTTTEGDVVLRLSNLSDDGGAIEVPLASDANVFVVNKRASSTGADETADWCLYFTMFEQVGCPGVPAPPLCEVLRRGLTTMGMPSHPGMMFETIACSNSQYP